MVELAGQIWTKPAGLITQGILGADCVGAVNNFFVLGGVDRNVPNDEYWVQWNAIGDGTDWPTPATDDARSKQSGRQTMPAEYGRVTSVQGNDFFGYIFQERGITKMTYVGGDVVFNFDTFEEDRGCIRAGRVKIDDKVFFESDRGFHVLENGLITDIGFGKVDDSVTGTGSI